jgi:hypothetical protein
MGDIGDAKERTPARSSRPMAAQEVIKTAVGECTKSAANWLTSASGC